MSDARLLSPEQAAQYLGLGSRWAIYRLVAGGQLPALKLAGKLRVDRADLDGLIEKLKTPQRVLAAPNGQVRILSAANRLAPLPARRRRNGQ